MRNAQWLIAAGLIAATTAGCVQSNGYPATTYYGSPAPTYYSPAPQVVRQTTIVPASNRPGSGDHDRDGIPNWKDPNDRRKAGSGDHDKDGIPNRKDPNDNRKAGSGDRDKDGIPNRKDKRPTVAKAPGSGDHDKDGIPNRKDNKDNPR